MKAITRAEWTRKYTKICAAAQRWHAKGYTAEQIANGIWNNWGYPTEVDNGAVIVWRKFEKETFRSVIALE